MYQCEVGRITDRKLAELAVLRLPNTPSSHREDSFARLNEFGSSEGQVISTLAQHLVACPPCHKVYDRYATEKANFYARLAAEQRPDLAQNILESFKYNGFRVIDGGKK